MALASDVIFALGQQDEAFTGHECSGIITATLAADTAESGLRIGDRVCAVTTGVFRTKERTRSTCAVRIPDEMSYEEAASIPVIYITAYHSLYDVARLQKGETVLIHAATGGVGQAALMLAQHSGAKIFATCGTAVKRDFLIKNYHLDPDHIFSSRDASFVSGIKALTNGKGVDVAINSLAGSLFKATWDSDGEGSVNSVEIGKLDIQAARHLDMLPLTRGASISGVDVVVADTIQGRRYPKVPFELHAAHRGTGH